MQKNLPSKCYLLLQQLTVLYTRARMLYRGLTSPRRIGRVRLTT